MARCSALCKQRRCFTLRKECTIGSLRQDADRYRPSNLEIGMGRRPASDLQTLEMENEYGEPRTISDLEFPDQSASGSGRAGVSDHVSADRRCNRSGAGPDVPGDSPGTSGPAPLR